MTAASLQLDARASTSTVAMLLEALPFACAAFVVNERHCVAANAQFGRMFHDANVPRSFVDEAVDGSERRMQVAGRWYEVDLRLAQPLALELLTAVDITERYEALEAHKHRQERLLFTSRMMSVGEVAITLAHELNQPLASIRNYLAGSLALIGERVEMSHLRQAMLAAHQQCEHASAVIARVREFVRAREPRREAVDIAGAVSSVMDLLRMEAERDDVAIRVALPEGLPQAWADRVMIEQVLLNLLRNAIEAMWSVAPAQRELSVDARVDLDDQIEIRVSDRGPGLGEAGQGQLFVPFFTTKPDGLGIGLAICRSIIEFHQGRIFHEPRPDGGSIFGFTLPPSVECVA